MTSGSSNRGLMMLQSGSGDAQGSTTGIDPVEGGLQRIRDNRIYTIDSRYLGTNVPSSFRGVYIQNGEKLIKIK